MLLTNKTFHGLTESLVPRARGFFLSDTGPRPLADRLRPQALDQVIGQEQVLGPDAPLGTMLASGSLSSLIFWGPPGVGKTTIARLLADETDLHFVQISAIFTGVPELRKVFEAAKMRRANGKGTLRRGKWMRRWSWISSPRG